jgi:hypothetical protein
MGKVTVERDSCWEEQQVTTAAEPLGDARSATEGLSIPLRHRTRGGQRRRLPRSSSKDNAGGPVQPAGGALTPNTLRR